MPVSSNFTPLDLFEQLKPRPEGTVRELWPCQVEMLQKYYEDLRRKQRIAIELPTGSGKSIIALLILDWWRRVKPGSRVAMTAATKALARELAERCADLKIPCVIVEGNMDESDLQEAIFKYQRGRCVCIMNYWAYLYKTDIPIPEILVVDDAHHFEEALTDFYSLRISRRENLEIYEAILRKLRNRFPLYTNIEGFLIDESAPESVEVLSFKHYMDILDEIVAEIELLADDESALSFALRYNRNRLQKYIALVSRDEIVLRPFVIPGGGHGRIEPVKQIVFMSATLGTEEMVHRTLGHYEPISVVTEADLDSEIRMGTHMVVPLTDTNTSSVVSSGTKAAIAEIISAFKKALILCTSHKEAEDVKEFLENEGCVVEYYSGERSSERFRSMSEGALVVPGRFIGMDFPDDTCRVEILVKIPYVLNPVDAFTKNVLEDSNTIYRKVSQRLVQAFGRCNRNPEDYAVYLVLDTRFGREVNSQKLFPNFPLYMRIETEAGYISTEFGKTEKAIALAERFLARERTKFDEEIEEGQRAYQMVDVLPHPTSDYYLDEIKAWHELVLKDNFEGAADLFISAGDELLTSEYGDSSSIRAAWMYYLAGMCRYLAFSFYDDTSSKTDAIQLLRKARDTGGSAWFRKLSRTINDIEGDTGETIPSEDVVEPLLEEMLIKWDDFKRANSNPNRKRTPLHRIEELKNKISTGTHGEMCDALKEIFSLLGYTVKGTWKQQGEPDLKLFSLQSERPYVVAVEVKSADESEGQVGVSDISKALAYGNRVKNEFESYDVLPLLLSNRSDISEDALKDSEKSVRIFLAQELELLIDRFYALMEESWHVSDLREKHRLMDRMTTPQHLRTLFEPAEKPRIRPDEIDGL